MSDIDLASYYEEVTKTAGLKPEATEVNEDEKVAAVVAVTEQFDIDGIAFESEDEKIAAAVAIIEGFEALPDADASEDEEKDAGKGIKAQLAQRARLALKGGRSVAKKVKAHLGKHKAAYAAGAGGAAAGGIAGYVAGRRK